MIDGIKKVVENTNKDIRNSINDIGNEIKMSINSVLEKQFRD